MSRFVTFLLVFLWTLPCFAGAPPAPRNVDIPAPDGIPLKATYYPAAKPGPAVLLLHMCNTTRQSWRPLAEGLAAAGIHALALDYRGFGESGGERFHPGAEQQQTMREKWPGDVDAALAYLLGQPGVDSTRLGAAGGSCGVTQAVQVARRHPQVRSLALLAGPADADGLQFLMRTPWLPVFTAAAADDQFDADALHSMQWLGALNGNPRNRFMGFADGKHGTEIFGPHPELPRQIVAWFVDTLTKHPADPKVPVTAPKNPMAEFWALVNQPAGVPQAVEMFHAARQRDAKAFLFPEAALNLLAYQRMQDADLAQAITLFQLNTEAYPDSANVYDSLGDAYVAAGQNELALAATRKALELLPGVANQQFREAIRQSAEQKLQKLAPAEAK